MTNTTWLKIVVSLFLVVGVCSYAQVGSADPGIDAGSEIWVDGDGTFLVTWESEEFDPDDNTNRRGRQSQSVLTGEKGAQLALKTACTRAGVQGRGLQAKRSDGDFGIRGSDEAPL